MSLKRYRVQTAAWFAILSAICLANKAGYIKLADPTLGRLMKGYFNDTFGCVCFLLLISLALTFCVRRRLGFNLIHVELLTLLCGLFWEYVTPLYRPATVSDPFDLVAYLLGGIIFWFVCRGRKNPLINKTS